MSKKHKWVLAGMIAIPFVIAIGFRTFDNHQFYKQIRSNQAKSSDPFKDDCTDFLIHFKIQI